MIKRKLLSPFQKFVNLQSSSGILLLATTIIALIWANSAFSESYLSFWNYEIGIVTDSFELKKPLILWVNDGLMAIFFFLIGLAILKVLGNRVPLSLKIFLTAFAIVDDLAAVLVIAIFYSSSLNLILLAYALGILAVVYFLSYKGFYFEFFTIVVGFVIWLLFLKAGLHPTLAGILMAFAIPVRQKISTHEFTDQLDTVVKKIKDSTILQKPVLSVEQLHLIEDLEGWSDKYRSPLQHLEHKLHNWVAYLVIPIFALANAGVAISGGEGLETVLIVNIMVCLIIGKSIGISVVIFLARKLKIIEVPADITNKQIIGVSFLAGIGFTMAIFIAGLAFSSSPEYIDSAKIGILIGSFISAIIGYGILRFKTVKGKFDHSK